MGEKQTHVLHVCDFPGWFSKEHGINDKPLLRAALKIMEEADVLVAHYGDRFDRPYFNSRCLIHGLMPPPPTKQRDTCQIAWKQFKFSSNRLGNLAQVLGVSELKMQKKGGSEWPGWWLGALAGNKRAIRAMGKYCAQDVRCLEQIYLRLRAYDQGHVRLISDRTKCGIRGGPIQYRGFLHKISNKYRRYQCQKCHHWGQKAKPLRDRIST